jgi:hypothetical protein
MLSASLLAQDDRAKHDSRSGNMLAKQIEYLCGAWLAGIVLGAKVPIIFTSRADALESRLLRRQSPQR